MSDVAGFVGRSVVDGVVVVGLAMTVVLDDPTVVVAVAVGVVGATVVAGAGWVVATGPTSCIAGAGSSRSAPLPSLGMSIHRISPT